MRGVKGAEGVTIQWGRGRPLPRVDGVREAGGLLVYPLPGPLPQEQERALIHSVYGAEKCFQGAER